MGKLNLIFNYIFLFIVVYIYIHNPVLRFIGVGSIKILLFISVLYLLKKKVEIFKWIHPLNYLFVLIYVTLAYLFFILAVNNSDDKSFYSLFIWLIESFVISVFIVEYISRNKLLKMDIIDIFIYEGIIASIITLFLLLNPESNLYLQNNVIIVPDVGLTNSRNYGIAEGLTSSYGVVQGIFAGFLLFRFKKHPLLILFILPMLISVLINARTGMIMFLIPFCYVIANSLLKFNVKILFVLLLFVFAIGFIIDNVDLSIYEEMLFFVESFFTSTIDYFLYGQKTDYYVVLDNMLQTPKTFCGILFGTGHSRFGLSDGSDIGFVNQIFIGGVIYLLLLIWIQMYLYYLLYRFSKKANLALYLFVVSFIVNFKGLTFCCSESFAHISFLLL